MSESPGGLWSGTWWACGLLAWWLWGSWWPVVWWPVGLAIWWPRGLWPGSLVTWMPVPGLWRVRHVAKRAGDPLGPGFARQGGSVLSSLGAGRRPSRQTWSQG